MAKASVLPTPKIRRLVIDLDEKEATYLMTYMQNAWVNGEPEEITNIRAALFNALQQDGVKPL